jgi:hypothetical protein
MHRLYLIFLDVVVPSIWILVLLPCPYIELGKGRICVDSTNDSDPTIQSYRPLYLHQSHPDDSILRFLLQTIWLFRIAQPMIDIILLHFDDLNTAFHRVFSHLDTAVVFAYAFLDFLFISPSVKYSILVVPLPISVSFPISERRS